MPPLTLHINVARRVADTLGATALRAERGGLYMGSTAPDIRVLTHWERERTHYFDLHTFDEQSGPRAFFEANPALQSPGSLSEKTAAFVAGYLTHLVMDETWINNVYRPHFGHRSPLGGGLRANVMDRALQFSLDARYRDDPHLMTHILDAVARCDLGFEIDFIDRDTLGDWHRVIVEMMSSPADWERFRRRAHRFVSNGEVTDELEELTRSLPDLVDQTLRYLTTARVDAFMEDAFQASARVVREYLDCA